MTVIWAGTELAWAAVPVCMSASLWVVCKMNYGTVVSGDTCVWSCVRACERATNSRIALQGVA